MSLENVRPIVAVQAGLIRDGNALRMALGELLQLTVDAVDEDGVLVKLGDGTLLRLAGLNSKASVGEILLLRVLATTPRLELGLLKSLDAVLTPIPAAADKQLLAEHADTYMAQRWSHTAVLRDGAQPLRAVLGQILQLTVDTIVDDAVLLKAADGSLWRLNGFNTRLNLGELLFMRVLATTPNLELGLVKVLPQATVVETADDVQPAAMRTDQVTMLRRMNATVQDAATLGLSWRTMVLAHIEQQLVQRAQSSGQHIPGNLFASEIGATLLRDMPRTLPGIDMAVWAFAAQVWAGRRLLLSVQGNADEGAARKRRRATLTLRMKLVLPGGGMAILQLQQLEQGLLLDLVAEQDSGMHILRGALRQIVAAVGRAELRVVRCRLMRNLSSAAQAVDIAQLPARAFSPALFRAAAELALLLSNLPRPTSTDSADDADLALLGDLVVR